MPFTDDCADTERAPSPKERIAASLVVLDGDDIEALALVAERMAASRREACERYDRVRTASAQRLEALGLQPKEPE